MAAKPKPKELVALASFACFVDGVETIVRQGDVLPADDALVEGREELFAAASAE